MSDKVYVGLLVDEEPPDSFLFEETLYVRETSIFEALDTETFCYVSDNNIYFLVKTSEDRESLIKELQIRVPPVLVETQLKY